MSEDKDKPLPQDDELCDEFNDRQEPLHAKAKRLQSELRAERARPAPPCAFSNFISTEKSKIQGLHIGERIKRAWEINKSVSFFESQAIANMFLVAAAFADPTSKIVWGRLVTGGANTLANIYKIYKTLSCFSDKKKSKNPMKTQSGLYAFGGSRQIPQALTATTWLEILASAFTSAAYFIKSGCYYSEHKRQNPAERAKEKPEDVKKEDGQKEDHPFKGKTFKQKMVKVVGNRNTERAEKLYYLGLRHAPKIFPIVFVTRGVLLLGHVLAEGTQTGHWDMQMARSAAFYIASGCIHPMQERAIRRRMRECSENAALTAASENNPEDSREIEKTDPAIDGKLVTQPTPKANPT